RAEQLYTHAPWASERANSYDRREFLGHSVPELAMARELYERHPDFPEGRHAKIRSRVVSSASCGDVSRQPGAGRDVREGSGDGPPHDRRVTPSATIDGEQFGVGSGESKEAAEQEAAKEALAKLGLEVEPPES